MVKFQHFRCRIYQKRTSELAFRSLVLRVVNQLKIMGECML
jgi:hypothetical protein